MPASTEEKTLEAVAGDVSYEVKSLFEAAALFQQFEAHDEGPDVPTETCRRLIFEALLLHFRNLLDFFFGGAKNSDDVHASHFFAEASMWAPARPYWLDEYRHRCNKLLAHLTYSRLEYSRKGKMGWDFDEQLRQIQKTWKEFLEKLPTKKQLWFR